MVSKYRRSGWFNESHRHSLARQGIKTGQKINYSTHRQRRDAVIGGVAGLLVAGPIGAVAGAGTGYVVGSEKKKINYGRQLSSGEFRIDDNTTIVCRSESTSYGFRHIAELYRNGSLVETAKATYQNRTWEKYEYQSVISKLLDKVGYKDAEKQEIMGKVEAKALGKVESQFKSVAMVASLGNIFGQSPKEKNDWKARMLKAGLGSKGLEMPEDWDTLSEDEKGKRLDKIIELLNKKKIDMAKKTEILSTRPGEKVIWQKDFSTGLKDAKQIFGTDKFVAYVSKTKDGKYGGVIDEKGSDQTHFGDTFKTKEQARKAIEDEIHSMKVVWKTLGYN